MTANHDRSMSCGTSARITEYVSMCSKDAHYCYGGHAIKIDSNQFDHSGRKTVGVMWVFTDLSDTMRIPGGSCAITHTAARMEGVRNGECKLQ